MYRIKLFRKTRESKKQVNKTIELLKKAFVSSLTKKIAAGVITFVLIIGTMIHRNVTDPIVDFVVEGIVLDATTDYPIPMENVLITVSDKNVKTKTNSKGFFKIVIPMRRSEGAVFVVCSMDNYRFREKPLRIPVDDKSDKPTFTTTFHLKYKGHKESDFVNSSISFVEINKNSGVK